MAVLSILLRSAAKTAILPKCGASVANCTTLLRPNASITSNVLRYMSGHHNMAIKPSRWSWNRFKDLVHFYFFLGAIPATAVILYVNLFIGPARLAEIPEGYTPEAHEYHAHPITRWMARKFAASYQQEYEMMLHHIYEEDYKKKLRLAEKRIRQKMMEKDGAETFYYQPVTARYQRFAKDSMKKTEELTGVN
uniref:NADH dehydrogenase [ubiquinone] 1 beta subcomplex subunit 5, mitochondrial n=1 Tax=Moina brachiata TaxID=675436 RepID=A0A4Y7NL48_9CRUS|nr:EOG090X0FIE [Moina brachiata]SVE93314.1 EOG090X0FIE [Moina brachiata]